MRKAILFLLATMMMAGCAEQQNFDNVALDAPAQMTRTENFNDLMTQARWGDGNAYLKLADYYINGQNGTKPDFMATISMLSMAEEFGAIGRPGDYISNLPENDNTRMAFEAMKSINNRQGEKGMQLADLMIEKGCADGHALKGYALMEMGDTIEAIRLATLAAEQGSSLGWALQYVIPYAQMSDMPDESIMLPIAEAVPIFYRFMAEEYYKQLAEHPENDVKVARCYLKADENGCLDRRGANWLLSYKERGNELRDDRCQRHACDAKPQICHKCIVQNDVDTGCYQQIDQCGHRIAQTAQHAAEDVVIAAACDSQADDDQVISAPQDDALRRPQKTQKRHGHHRSHDHDDQRGHSGQHYAGADGLGQRLSLPGTEKLRHHNTGTHRNTHEQHEHQVQDRPGAADGGQRVVTDKPADDNAVHSVIELLGDIPKQHRNRKFNDLEDRIALRHINRRK